MIKEKLALTNSSIALHQRIENLVSRFDKTRTSDNAAAIGLDLDKTIIFTKSSINLPHDSRESLRLVEFHKGKPLSYMTEATHAMLSMLHEEHHVIPVTARRQNQMDRIMFPWGTPETFVCLSGAEVTVEGKKDDDWAKLVRQKIADSCIPLSEISKIMDPYRGESWVLEEHTFGNMFEVITLNTLEIPESFIDDIHHKLEGTGFFASLQGRKLHLTPHVLSKGDAFKHVVEQLGVTGNTYGAGDSLMDISLLEAVDFAFHPLHGEMVERGLAPSNSTQTVRGGVLGGEELVARIFASLNDYRS